ncbi:MAG: molybdopterin-dependent oxidoreductase [Humibacillus sp.]|nr:molybdopterin-dependent oxidoreductase [Humibacillus sp.]MDN5775463.1 molybdopterin-dependent oxidoreductase [Humibacillus sp.]
MMTTLAEALPRSRFSERHALDIEASPDQVWSALTALRWSDLRLTTPLMLLRGMGRTPTARGRRVLGRGPVVPLHLHAPWYAATGAIGRPWQLRPERGPSVTNLQGIADFAEPGWLKYGMDFALEELPSGGTRVATTTLCEPTDESALRRFRPYWLLIRPFSGLIRRDLLHTIARRARPAVHNDVAPGQRVLIGPAPRFGLPQYLCTPFALPVEPVITVTGRAGRATTLTRQDLGALPATTKALDLHCVMTWSVEGTRWSGWSFADLWSQLLAPHADATTTGVVFTGLDGAMASIPLALLLRDDVMLAHTRDGEPLGRAHGAPYRLVVPQLYGYKNIKHVCRIDLVDHHVCSPHEPWIMHRLGRVAPEERHGLGLNRLARLAHGLSRRRTLRSYGLSDPRFR